MVAANVPVATITTRSNGTKRYGARTDPLTSSIVDLATRRATTAATTPTTDPTSPVQQPCSASERRTNRSGAPLADSWPTVTSWRRALVANAAEMMMPVAARAMAPATQPQASARLCESALLSCPRQDTRASTR